MIELVLIKWYEIKLLKIQRRCYFMGGNRWADDEINIMKIYYSSTDAELLLKLLPNRNLETITKKAQELKIIKKYF